MAEIHSIPIEPWSLAQMCALHSKPIPQHVIDKLDEPHKKYAEGYNEEVKHLHWHVKDDDGHDVAFADEATAEGFHEIIWQWYTGGDEDSAQADQIDVIKCHNLVCRVHTNG